MTSHPSTRFWAKVDFSTPNGCWLWTGAQHGNGYGEFWTAEGRRYAHRIAFGLVYGEIPGRLHVCHRCDTPLCVRPEHLFLGTQADNVRDMHAKGRGVNWAHNPPRAEKSGVAKLTWAQVAEIRGLVQTSLTYRAIAERFDVSPSLVSLIARNRIWQVEGATPRMRSRRRGAA